MGIEGLDKIFNPERIAVIGASNQEGSVGFRLFNNLIGVGFRGFVYPVNPFRPSVQGVTAYPSVRKIPWKVDLAIVATPAHVVPQVVEECGESGLTGIIIISSGFGETGAEGKSLEEELLKLKRAHGLRIIGPNCLGVIRPSVRLNATFVNKTARPGRIAFISQSGALCASVLDWAAHANVGFSSFVSVGGMIDVDFSDLIDYFGVDPETRSIILYIEAIKDPRKFMSAARRFAGTKPIVVVKAGKSPEGARAAAAHTGATTGDDAIYHALFARAGIVRVEEIADLFNCSEILAMQPPPKGPKLAIITNAGGPGVIAADTLIARAGRLAALSDETIQALGRILPHYWSRSNPIDICEDATLDRFRMVLKTCFRDPNVDGYLVIYVPTVAADPDETARVLIEISKDTGKPLLTSWLGEEDVREARNILRRNKIPTYSTPEQAVATFMYMYQYARNLGLLYETPEELALSLSADKRHLQRMVKTAAKEGKEMLTEDEAKEFLEAYGIPTTRTYVTVPSMVLGGHELVIRSKRDPQFGSVIVFGTGGVGVELFNDISVGFPPLNQTLARRMIEQTRAYKIFSEGIGGEPPLNIRLLEETLVGFSQLIVDFAQIKEAEVNVLLVDEKSIIASDAHIVLDLKQVPRKHQPYEHLIIRPYPTKYVTKRKLRDGGEILLRPIKPEDESFLVGLFQTFSEETMRFRFFQVIKEISHETLARYCNIDYDREVSMVAEMTEEGRRRVIGMVRLVVQPDGESGEVAVVVGDIWQNRGLGTTMLDCIIEIGKDMGLKRMFGEILSENTKMMHICCKRGFEVKRVDEETYLATLNLQKKSQN